MRESRTDLAEVFSNLRTWRAQPGYQLERRVDALISPYLSAFLETRFGEGALVKLVTSEFPIPKSLLTKTSGRGDGRPERRNVSADFLLLRREPNPAWILLELKTDMRSLDDTENQNYSSVAGMTMKALLRGLRKAKKNTASEKAYRQLAWRVAAHGHPKAKIEICYLQPVRRGKEIVSDGEKIVRTYTLQELISSDVGKSDELWKLIKTLLRGVVRSDKGRGKKAKA